jgi:hypothetical protein
VGSKADQDPKIGRRAHRQRTVASHVGDSSRDSAQDSVPDNLSITILECYIKIELGGDLSAVP